MEIAMAVARVLAGVRNNVTAVGIRRQQYASKEKNMKNTWKSLVLAGCFFSLLPAARAVDINLLNVNLGSPDSLRAQQLYGNAYGFSPQQVAPAMLGPAEEVPAIMQIAQAAGTVPLSIWMMRKMGMSYSNIMQTFAVAPLVSMGSPINDTSYIQTTRNYFLQNILQMPSAFLPKVPLIGPDFTRFIIYPVSPKVGYWMPPGIAKKYGLWIPPGQAKKMGLWDGPVFAKGGHWGEDEDGDHGWKHHGHGDDEDHGWKHHGHGDGDDHGHGHGGGGFWGGGHGHGKH